MRHHLESLEEECRAGGLPPDGARRAALRDFGGVVSAREAYRRQRGIPLLETVLTNVRLSVRPISNVRS